jgi:hypothetical protein
VIDLIRGLLDRPLDPRHARAIVVVASCLTLAFAGLVGFGVISGSRPTAHEDGDGTSDLAAPTAPPAATIEGSPGGSDEGPADQPETLSKDRQDPQDRHGSSAYRRARRTLREHRALQHLPFHGRGLSITLTGADQGRAIVRIVAATVPEARRRWRRFLRRYSDAGGAYEARFAARPETRSIPARGHRSRPRSGHRHHRKAARP